MFEKGIHKKCSNISKEVIKMNFPSDLKYAKTHEWIREEDGLIVIGLTDFAQDQLGDIVFVGLPEVGDAVEVGDSFADVESVKAVSDIYSPVSGVVAEVNEELLDAPESVNGDPYGAWLIKVKDVSDEEEGLLDADAYEAFCEAGGEA
jgi:glycine cleavage system H protein